MKLQLCAIFATLLKLSKGLLNCDIIKNRQPTDFDLSKETITATKRNNSEVYQVLSFKSCIERVPHILNVFRCSPVHVRLIQVVEKVMRILETQ